MKGFWVIIMVVFFIGVVMQIDVVLLVTYYGLCIIIGVVSIVHFIFTLHRYASKNISGISIQMHLVMCFYALLQTIGTLLIHFEQFTTHLIAKWRKEKQTELAAAGLAGLSNREYGDKAEEYVQKRVQKIHKLDSNYFIIY